MQTSGPAFDEAMSLERLSVCLNPEESMFTLLSCSECPPFRRRHLLDRVPHMHLPE